MGKPEDEQSVPTTVVNAQSDQGNADSSGCRLSRFVSFRCVFVLLLGFAVLLSSIFWLPFFHFGDQTDLDLDPRFGGHDIVASFMLKKPLSLLEDNITRLQDDIFDEFPVATTKVEILSLETSDGSNITRVVFAVDSEVKHARLSLFARSLIRASFVSLVTRQNPLQLSASLFGNPYSFDVLKFTGGITVSPPQSAFLMQKVQIFFNFTLNFSIDEIQDNFTELTNQLRSGLRLTPYENLYVSLTNLRGSTVGIPTIIQCQVLMAVGINPSRTRLKQLAQTITDSHGKNLGLNNTVFGKVKQVCLSSVLQHSLGGDGIGTLSPSPAPLPHPQHHHHNHHRHHHNHNAHIAPAIPPVPQKQNGGSISEKGSPAPTPVPASSPQNNHEAEPPGCHFGYRRRFPHKAKKHSRLVPPVAPPVSHYPEYTAPSPQHRINPPESVPHLIPASSPLPSVAFSHVHPPSKSKSDDGPPNTAPSALPSPSSSPNGIRFSYLCAALLFQVVMLEL